MTVRVNFTAFAGEDVSVPVTVYTDDTLAVKQNITGWALAFTARTTAGTVVVTKTTAAGGIVLTDPTNGLATVTLLAADTAGTDARNLLFAVSRTDSGLNRAVTEGLLTLLVR
jgi:hypothetical protein